MNHICKGAHCRGLLSPNYFTGSHIHPSLSFGRVELLMKMCVLVVIGYFCFSIFVFFHTFFDVQVFNMEVFVFVTWQIAYNILRLQVNYSVKRLFYHSGLLKF